MTDQPERRAHPRIDVNLPLRLTIGGKTVETEISNLSNSGIRFRTPAALPLLSRVQIALELPEGNVGVSAPLAITGVVVRCDQIPGGEPTPYDTAIFFEDLSDRARGQLSHFVAQQKT